MSILIAFAPILLVFLFIQAREARMDNDCSVRWIEAMFIRGCGTFLREINFPFTLRQNAKWLNFSFFFIPESRCDFFELGHGVRLQQAAEEAAANVIHGTPPKIKSGPLADAAENQLNHHQIYNGPPYVGASVRHNVSVAFFSVCCSVPVTNTIAGTVRSHHSFLVLLQLSSIRSFAARMPRVPCAPCKPCAADSSLLNHC